MKTLYFDCSMGAAGDMLTASLVELLPDATDFVREMEDVGIPHVSYCLSPSVKCGIKGTHFSVKVNDTEEDEHLHDHCHHDHSHEHSHSAMEEIAHRISHLNVSESVAKDILGVYTLLAEAESQVHGVPVPQIHFHEVGTLDALADITAVCLLIHKLKPDRIFASPIHVGSGQVRCAHGILPVPAPATTELLKDIPIYSGDIRGELCTPTGAALLKYFVQKFCAMPTMTPVGMGYGMGKKDFPAANCVRAILGEDPDGATEEVLELSCNLDDMSPEHLAFATEILMEQGALDVYTTPIGMKKNRPATLLTVLCREAQKETMIHLLFKHTTTLGIRETLCRRYTLHRQFRQVASPYGPVTQKLSTGYGVTRSKYEYADLAKIAKEKDLPLSEILNSLPR